MTFPNCPEEYYYNCKNAPWRCEKCIASGSESASALLYEPKHSSKSKHPYTPIKGIVAKKKTNNPAKAGRKVERKLAEDNKDLVPTVNSGAVFGDGDYKALNSKLKIDAKSTKKTESFTLAKRHYIKGLSQGVNCWLLVNKFGDTVAVLEYETFKWLVNAAKDTSL